MSTVTLYKDKLTKAVSHETKFLDFILYNRSLDNAVTRNNYIYKLWSIDDRYREKSLSTLQKWWYCFMHRHFLTFRRNTHVA